MSNDETSNLKLIGKNKEDLQVISAYCQDSIVKVEDIVFLNCSHSSSRLIYNL